MSPYPLSVSTYMYYIPLSHFEAYIRWLGDWGIIERADLQCTGNDPPPQSAYRDDM